MGFLQIPPPQGFSKGQELSIITGPASPRFGPPQGTISTPPDMAYENAVTMEYEDNVVMEYEG